MNRIRCEFVYEYQIKEDDQIFDVHIWDFAHRNQQSVWIHNFELCRLKFLNFLLTRLLDQLLTTFKVLLLYYDNVIFHTNACRKSQIFEKNSSSFCPKTFCKNFIWTLPYSWPDAHVVLIWKKTDYCFHLSSVHLHIPLHIDFNSNFIVSICPPFWRSF